jgi:hypothetical protein
MTPPLAYRVDRFLKQNGMSATRFGRLSVRDPRFVGDLRNGRQPGTRVLKSVEHFMNNYRAKGDMPSC